MFKCKKDKKNTGALLEKPQVEQYILGASPIEFVTRLHDGDWSFYLPEDELQKRNNVETMSCVSFSALNSIEIQLNWMLRHNEISEESKKFLVDNNYIINNMVNLSDKYTALMSNTTRRGNYLTNVAQAIRDFGVIPESMLPFGEPSNWDEYHDKDQITEEMTALGAEFLKYFNVQYEWVVSPIGGKSLTSRRLAALHHLKQAPLQIAKDGHATDYYMVEDKVKWGQYDTYAPFKKDKPWDYDPIAVMKILLTDKNMYTPSEVAAAKAEIKKIMENRKSPFFWRPEQNGEAYIMYEDGSFKYKKGVPCPLFASFIAEGYLVPISESLWDKVKAAEIK